MLVRLGANKPIPTKSYQKGMRDNVSARIEDLNREMMRLSKEERRARWKEYYERLSSLTGQ